MLMRERGMSFYCWLQLRDAIQMQGFERGRLIRLQRIDERAR